MQVRALRLTCDARHLVTASVHVDALTKSRPVRDSRNAVTCTFVQPSVKGQVRGAASPGPSAWWLRPRRYCTALTCNNASNCTNVQVRGLRPAYGSRGLPTAPAHAGAATEPGRPASEADAVARRDAQHTRGRRWIVNVQVRGG